MSRAATSRARARSTIERYFMLAEDMDEDLSKQDGIEGGDYYRRRLFAAMRACGRGLGRHVENLEARMTGGEFQTFRIAGDDAIDFFLSSWRLDDALALAPRHEDAAEYFWFQRTTLAVRARVHRAMSYYQVRYSLPRADVAKMIELGEMYQWVHKHAGMGVTYSDFYLTKGNPYGLQRLAGDLIIANEKGEPTSSIFGVAAVAGAQGGERFNAHHKIMYPLMTSGRAGSEYDYVLSTYAVRLAIASGDFPESAPPLIHKNQRRRWPVEDDDEEDTPTRGGGDTARADWSCACGRPSSPSEEYDVLELDVPRASCLRLERGYMMCRTCHNVAKMLCELCQEKPTGTSTRVIELKELARKHEAAQARLDTRAEANRNRRAKEEKKKIEEARRVATASDQLEVEQVDTPPLVEEQPRAQQGAVGGEESSSDEDPPPPPPRARPRRAVARI